MCIYTAWTYSSHKVLHSMSKSSTRHPQKTFYLHRERERGTVLQLLLDPRAEKSFHLKDHTIRRRAGYRWQECFVLDAEERGAGGWAVIRGPRIICSQGSPTMCLTNTLQPHQLHETAKQTRRVGGYPRMMYRHNETHFNTTDQEKRDPYQNTRQQTAFRTGFNRKGRIYGCFNWPCEGQRMRACV